MTQEKYAIVAGAVVGCEIRMDIQFWDDGINGLRVHDIGDIRIETLTDIVTSAFNQKRKIELRVWRKTGDGEIPHALDVLDAADYEDAGEVAEAVLDLAGDFHGALEELGDGALDAVRKSLAAAAEKSDMTAPNFLAEIQFNLHRALNTGELRRDKPHRFHAVKKEVEKAQVLLNKINGHVTKAAEFVAAENMDYEVRRNTAGVYSLKK